MTDETKTEIAAGGRGLQGRHAALARAVPALHLEKRRDARVAGLAPLLRWTVQSSRMKSKPDEHFPHVRDDQESPYWTIRCSCGWRSGVCTELDASVESYGEHMRSVGAAVRPPTGKTDWDWYDGFERWVMTQNLSPSSTNTYLVHVRRFLRWKEGSIDGGESQRAGASQ